MKIEGIKVVLRSLPLSSRLFLQEIALLDNGVNLHYTNDGQPVLPTGKYGMYYRVVLDCKNHGFQELTDYDGASNVTEIMDRLLK